MPEETRRTRRSITEAAEQLSSHPDTVRRLISRGVLPAHRINGTRSIRIWQDDLDALTRPIATGVAHGE